MKRHRVDIPGPKLANRGGSAHKPEPRADVSAFEAWQRERQQGPLTHRPLPQQQSVSPRS
jgi:hypothetical protein